MFLCPGECAIMSYFDINCYSNFFMQLQFIQRICYLQNELDLDPAKSIMIGDRMNTDILFGNRNNLKTLLVYTGVDGPLSIEKTSQNDNNELKLQLPDYCMDTIGLWSTMFDSVS